MRDLILFRHGNTFDAGQEPTRLGCRNDLPMTPSGEVQAQAGAQALVALAQRPQALYAPHLKRTWRFAQILGEALNLAPQPDDRLIELDYGAWSGLTDPQIAQRFGADHLEGWNKRGLWPLQDGWGESEDIVAARTRAFAEYVATLPGDGPVIGVSSAGTLRFFLRLVPGAFQNAIEQSLLKVKTGHAAHLRWQNGGWALLGWNIPPDRLSQGI
ncbi:MAG: histidine phosphatase family protein [Alphaproteobacteria bacterium]|nr:MAG: histidine phosphatase family protein [Alphaproteobacteria bacterium]